MIKTQKNPKKPKKTQKNPKPKMGFGGRFGFFWVFLGLGPPPRL